MNIDCENLLSSITNYSIHLKNIETDNDFDKFLKLKILKTNDVDELIEYLTKHIVNPVLTDVIAKYFYQYLVLIVTNLINKNQDDGVPCLRRKCVVIAKLLDFDKDILKYTYQYFTSSGDIFEQSCPISPQQKKHKFSSDKKYVPEITDLDLLTACLKLLKCNYVFFRDIWNWSKFVEIYWNKGNGEIKEIAIEILALLTNLNSQQLNVLQKEIQVSDLIENEIFNRKSLLKNTSHGTKTLKWDINCDGVIAVEEVFLKVYNKENYKDFSNNKEIIKVNSTKINLRRLALGVSSGKPICLIGPVGSGKSSLVEYLAKVTGRIAPKCGLDVSKQYAKQLNPYENSKRKYSDIEPNLDECLNLTKCDGFLRIQLGDQTDGKMLLGQYSCTDIPGEFIWQPGVLTQAVLNGSWILMEDLDLATKDVCTILSNILDNNFLSVPGFRDYVKIEPGFQLFFTLRTQKNSFTSQNQLCFQTLEKYLYSINLLSLSCEELIEIIRESYPNLSLVAPKIVDVFLMFSSGKHSDEHKTQNAFNLPNTGRLVSTRDLIKLCRRSNPNFSVTSSECAYFVFQNAVELFCSHMPSGQRKTDLIVEIGAKLGIIESRCTSLANTYTPSVQVGTTSMKIGRVEMSTKKVKDDMIEDEVEFEVAPKKKRKIEEKVINFSFTRISSYVLERIAVAVQQNEPILLVGETGVGKTSVIQYLANKTKNKLVAINMNNQSDVSDLLGGFKPVDLRHIMLPLRNEFEYLFKQSFNAQKNEKLLTNLSICFSREDYNVLIKLMLRIISRLFSETNFKNVVKEIKTKWFDIQKRLLKLDSQLDKNLANIAFSFIPGSLVNCIKNGDWILLDEINLASSETLECLSTILEPDGSVILLEKGDILPIKRHPNFQIFACMNPNTDIGKKDLPTSIRNRFSEFFVDELVDENDLMIIVDDYLRNTGIQKTKVYNIVKLYKHLRNLANLKLNDGLGNRPVFSLRTLCRALWICAKNLCGSIERNLFESFCVSFLTQLDPESHKIVLALIQGSLLSNIKAVLSQQIPKPVGGEFLNFQGYWIQEGKKDKQDCENYILTSSVQSNLKDLSRIISIGRLPVLLQGPTSAGKTSLIEYIAKKSGNQCWRINNHEHTDLQEYIGTYTTDLTGKLSFQEGILVQAMRNGYWIILDELNLAPSDILEALNRVLDDNRELFITETQTLIKAHPNFMLFATQNPPGIYGGRKTLSRAFKNRFIELHFAEIPKPELEIILEKRCFIPKSYSQKMVKTMSMLQLNRKSANAKNNFTLRDLFRWGNRYTFADKRLLEDNLYDWNQHLVDEGYLVLSSKVRNNNESEIIINALFHNFRKRVILENLFSINETSSKVTNDILNKLEDHPKFKQIVWTFDMRRMAILISKALEFNEPVLLVGPTGCGKTTICQVIAESKEKNLRILNCHMHTEGADFLGGLRPYRGECKTDKLFEWADGPLVLSMIEAEYFLADEISLAEDAVLERLNCILEPERTVLLAEKGSAHDSSVELVIKAKDGFQFLATMNPGGDFGKKELSPALRNRFTEIWCRSTERKEELIKIIESALKMEKNILHILSDLIVDTVYFVKSNVEKLNISIRDIMSWSAYITTNFEKNAGLSLEECLFFGLETIFLDSLEMLPHESYEEIEKTKTLCVSYLENGVKKALNPSFDYKIFLESKRNHLEINDTRFGISPFFIEVISSQYKNYEIDFVFSTPTTKMNLFRLLSALSLNKSILLEGPPGVGKTTLIENLAKMIGYEIIRINLCEHTDLTDLFGTDLPSDDITMTEDDHPSEKFGSFVWRDGPLLSALKSKNTWILLDELNLAPQSVLEGLNAILDHRGEVFIPELNKTFKLGHKTRIFAAQNPLRQGGGRKGLPQSFLNRFTKVYLRKLTKTDLVHVINWKYKDSFKKLYIMYPDVNLMEKMVTFSQKLEDGISNHSFGLKGGPFEANLRDIIRWCSFTFNKQTGFLFSEESLEEFLLVLYEKMKIVYYERMRCDADKTYIRNLYQEMFLVNVDILEEKSSDICLFWTNDNIYLNDIVLSKNDENSLTIFGNHKIAPILLESQMQILKNITECVLMEQPIILSGPTDCGKTKLIDLFCTILNTECAVDTIDDSVTGSFQQVDYNRHLEEIANIIQQNLLRLIQKCIFNKDKVYNKKVIVKLMKNWESYKNSINRKTTKSTNTRISPLHDEILLFKNRICSLLQVLKDIDELSNNDFYVDDSKITLLNLLKIVEKSGTLNTGGRFEWVDSKIVKSLKYGEILCLEHVNLCSAAILDRLNSVLEPNGKLLISEKGVTSNNKAEIIEKHKYFRIFLTLDPRNGEISRAMRNRCIELFITKESYTENDLRKMIYVTGIDDISLIEVIIKIHNSLRNLSDYSVYGVSHILKFSYLVMQNLKMGLTKINCLKESAIEVYVSCTSNDLLGFGIQFYHAQLKDRISNEINKYEASDSADYCNLNNSIIHSNKMTPISLIKLQYEPLLVLLKSNCKNLSNLSTKYDKIIETISNNNYNRNFLLYTLYEVSSNDFEIRKSYLEKNINSSETITKLNKILFDEIKSSNINHLITDIPWNSKMFPRIRDYVTKFKIDANETLKLSLILLARTILDDIQINNETKINNISVINYSKSVGNKTISDLLNNEFINSIYAYLSNFPNFIINVLKSDKFKIDLKLFMNLSMSLLWFNRILTITNKKLFVNKKINEFILSSLIHHFKWMKKHCLNILENSDASEFMKIHKSILNIIQDRTHPLHIIRKLYVKNYSNFLPYYNTNQIKMNEVLIEYYNVLKPSSYLHSTEEQYIDYRKKFDFILSPNNISMRKTILDDVATIFDQFIWFRDNISDYELKENFSDDLKIEINSFISDKYKLTPIPSNSYSFPTNMMQTFSSEINTHDNNNEKVSIEILTILEYFALKGINISKTDTNLKCKINLEFYNNIPSIDIRLMHLLKITEQAEFKLCENLWIMYVKNFHHCFCNQHFTETSKFTQSTFNIPNALPEDFYKNYSTFKKNFITVVKRFEHNSLLLKYSKIIYSLPNKDAFERNIINEHNNDMQINQPMLTQTIFSILFTEDGDKKSVSINEIEKWENNLKLLNELMWNNILTLQPEFSFERSNLQLSLDLSLKLTTELSNVLCHLDKETNNKHYIEFNESIEALSNLLITTTKTILLYLSTSKLNNSSHHRFIEMKLSSVIYMLLGSIEINLSTYSEDLDPVEKNLLKKMYNDEDENYLSNLILSYDIIRISMTYKSLGEEIYRNLKTKKEEINARKIKFAKTVALRPENSKYNELIKDTNHFLLTCCHPKTLYNLIVKANQYLDFEIDNSTLESNNRSSNEYLQNISETIKTIELLIKNIERFELKTLEKYSSYYQDFLNPLEYCICLLKYGLYGTLNCLTQSQNSIKKMLPSKTYYQLNKEEELSNIIENIIEFPKRLDIDLLHLGKSDQEQNINIFLLLENMESTNSKCFLNLLKNQLLELNNSIYISSRIECSGILKLDEIYNNFNKIWQKQEENRIKRKQENDSLFVTKTRCATDDEESKKQHEINELFPNYVEKDFSDFIVNQTLEQVKTTGNQIKKIDIDIIEENNYEFICEMFITLMMNYSSSYYYNNKSSNNNIETTKLDFITPFEIRVNIFQSLFKEYRTLLSSRIDDVFYSGVRLVIGLTQQHFNTTEIFQKTNSTYNFYKDANIFEVLPCLEILKNVEIRVNKQLIEWPDHPVLKDISRIIRKISCLPSHSPVVRFSTGFQILRQKLDEWNQNAHRNNNFRDLEISVAEFVQKWTRLELLHWRESLTQIYTKIRSTSYKYWFLIYNLIHEYLIDDSDSTENVLNIDFKNSKVFEHFVDENEDEILNNETDKREKLKSNDIVGILKQFIENSNYADFTLRMDLVKAFELYLNLLANLKTNKKRVNTLISIFHNIYLYFEQFKTEVEDSNKKIRTPIEKKLKEFVKIESYSKDLSYFSMKNNVLHAHRNLYKFLKEYELEVKNKITPIFTYKSNTDSELVENREEKGKNFRFEAKVKYYMIDVKHFMASIKLKDKYVIPPFIDINSTKHLLNIGKLFTISRTIVKKTVLSASFPSLIYSLDTLLSDQIETCQYLKNLDIDRTQERKRQVAQAKSILNQKKKSLSDLFKTLSMLGLNYKTGLMEMNLNSNITNLKIQPFSVTDMLLDNEKHKRFDQNLIYLNENIHLYYVKCIFKTKILLNAILTANPEIDNQNIERIKGFSIDMFVLLQKQKIMISKSMKNLYDLRITINNLIELDECCQTQEDDALDFNYLIKKKQQIQTVSTETQIVFEQFMLLLKTTPENTSENNNLSVLKDFNFNKNTEYYKELYDNSSKILKLTKNLLKEINKTNQSMFINISLIKHSTNIINEIKCLIKIVIDNLKMGESENENLAITKPFNELLKSLEKPCDSTALSNTCEEYFDNFDNEFDNIIHNILISIQNIYKKHSNHYQDHTDSELKSENVEQDNENDTILEQHLKCKINLEIENDLKVLNILKIYDKLSNLCEIVRNTNPSTHKLNFVKKLIVLIPILEQYTLLGEYYLIQQCGAHKVSSKMLSILLSVFIELITKGFCIPQDLMQDEQGQKKQNETNNKSDGFGLEDGTGENDVSDRIESEDQLDDAKKPEDRKKEAEEKKEDDDCNEEKGIDMSEDFDSKLQDLNKKEDDDESESEKEEELEKQMGETEDGAEKLDEQIWGDDDKEEKQEDENESNQEEEGNGSREEVDNHNELDSQKEKESENSNENQQGLDAADQNAKEEKRKQKNDIDDIKESEVDEDHPNPHHNALEEPPEADDFKMEENININDDGKDNEENNDTENPYDIDEMKDQMETTEDDQEITENESTEKLENEDMHENTDNDEKDPEFGNDEKPDENLDEKKEDEIEDSSLELAEQRLEEEESKNNEEDAEQTLENKTEEYHQAKDNPSNEENIQSTMENNVSSKDQTQTEEQDKNQKTNETVDPDDNRNDKDGIGQTETEAEQSSHPGISDKKNANSNVDKSEDYDKQEQHKQRNNKNTDDNRTLSEVKSKENNRLKTIDKLNNVENENNKENYAEEYQHVKEPNATDKTTLDNATEEQSNKIVHDDIQEEKEPKEEENNEQLMDTLENDECPENKTEELKSEKVEQIKSAKKRNKQSTKEGFDTIDENQDIEGEISSTHTVLRGSETTSHAMLDLLNLSSSVTLNDTQADIEMKKMYEREKNSKMYTEMNHDSFEVWQQISNKMLGNARELCEQLRLILEPTKCTRLKGDYRTGRRINMRKIIPYIASQFRKDKIWLRRTKPAQRDYKITISVDDSKSMDHNQSKYLTLEAISLVSQALTLLESGKLSIISFGEKPNIILNYDEQFDGPKLINSLNFEQNQSRVAELLDFIRVANLEDAHSSKGNGLFENLLIVVSDGRNIFSEGEEKVKNSVKLARLQHIFIVYIIIDNPENKHSILDIRVPKFSSDKQTITMQSYLDIFPFPYYIIVRDISQLPIVLSEAMRQWFELVNSEQ